MKDTLIEGAPMWSNHIERTHGKIHAPNLPTYPPPPSELTKCLICRQILSVGRGIKSHFRIAHVQRGWFEKPFSCPECVHEEREYVEQINELEAWDDYVDRFHGGIQTPSGDMIENDIGRRRKKLRRKRGSAALVIPTVESQYRPYRRRSHRIRSLLSRVERSESETSTLVDDDTSTPSRLVRVSSSSSLSSFSSMSSSIMDCDIASRIDPRLPLG
jgi:hypothetical protein